MCCSPYYMIFWTLSLIWCCLFEDLCHLHLLIQAGVICPTFIYYFASCYIALHFAFPLPDLPRCWVTFNALRMVVVGGRLRYLVRLRTHYGSLLFHVRDRWMGVHILRFAFCRYTFSYFVAFSHAFTLFVAIYGAHFTHIRHRF